MKGERRQRRQNRAAEFVLPKENVQRLFGACGLRDRCLLELYYYSGLRRVEALGLDVPDIDFARRLVRVAKGKGAKERFAPLHPEVAERLRVLIGDRKRGAVFTAHDRGERRLGVRAVNNVFRVLSARTGIVNPNPRLRYLNPHLLRHTFARHFLATGGNLRDLSYILGHSGIGITADVYGTPTMEDIQVGYARFLKESGERMAADGER